MSISQRVYYINTLYKTSGTNENFKFSIQIPDEGYDGVVLLQASIPSSFYLIQDGYNTFALREKGVDTTIAIPPGNYSARVFANVVKELLTTSSPNGWVYTISLPNSNIAPSTGKFTYTVSGNDDQPSIVCSRNVNEQFGFAVDSVNTFVENSIVSTTTVNFSLEGTLFIHSDIAHNGDSDVLQEIYSGNHESFSLITYLATSPDLYSKVLQNNKSNIFNFSITNEKGQMMNLNGVDAQFTLCLYRHDSTHNMIRKYIQYKVHSEEQPQSEE